MKRALRDRDPPFIVNVDQADRSKAEHLLRGMIRSEKFHPEISEWALELELPTFYDNCRSHTVAVLFLMQHLCTVIDEGISKRLFLIHFNPSFVMRAEQICRFRRRDIEYCNSLEFRHVDELVLKWDSASSIYNGQPFHHHQRFQEPIGQPYVHQRFQEPIHKVVNLMIDGCTL